MNLKSLLTPCLILDEAKLQNNVDRMTAKIKSLGGDLRPHVKTSKSVEVSERAIAGHSGAITVSTLNEARYFAEAGFKDILYAVGIVPSKLPEVTALQDAGIQMTVILDSLEAAEILTDWAAAYDATINVLIEVNVDDHRAGFEPDEAELVATARHLHDAAGAKFSGVMTHAGGSYNCDSLAAITAMAEQERSRLVQAADRIRNSGYPCEIVSAGSTPTATMAKSLGGITEMRAGVYVFFDLVQAGLGVCKTDDIALSVLTSVIGHKAKFNRLIVDAGALALSKDHGTSGQKVDWHYGAVCQADTGEIIDNLMVVGVNQEHGLITTRDGKPLDMNDFPIGSRLRILPNHACMTAAAYDKYHVLNDGEITKTWPRCNGW